MTIEKKDLKVYFSTSSDPQTCPRGKSFAPLYSTLHYAPTSKKMEGHIASGTFVRPSVRYAFLMHSITSEPCKLGFGNLIYGFFMKK